MRSKAEEGLKQNLESQQAGTGNRHKKALRGKAAIKKEKSGKAGKRESANNATICACKKIFAKFRELKL
jgi:hypothetical protein